MLNPTGQDPIDPNELIRYGMGEAVRLMTDIARAEAVRGDGRALRAIQRLSEAAGLVRVKRPLDDDGA